jgi:hypothetical protein
MDILSEPPHLSVGRLLFIKPESLFNEITDCLSGSKAENQLSDTQDDPNHSGVTTG